MNNPPTLLLTPNKETMTLVLTITPPPTPEIARCRIPLNEVIQNRIGSWGQRAWVWMAMWCPRQLATITDQQTHFQTLNTKLFHLRHEAL